MSHPGAFSQGRTRRDVDAYRATPPTASESAIAQSPRPWTDLVDDTDWEALYDGESA